MYRSIRNVPLTRTLMLGTLGSRVPTVPFQRCNVPHARTEFQVTVPERYRKPARGRGMAYVT